MGAIKEEEPSVKPIASVNLDRPAALLISCLGAAFRVDTPETHGCHVARFAPGPAPPPQSTQLRNHQRLSPTRNLSGYSANLIAIAAVRSKAARGHAANHIRPSPNATYPLDNPNDTTT
jgi:hypothetical protein